MMHRKSKWLTATLFALAGCGGPTCSEGDLSARLAASRVGDVVSIAGCDLTGHFVVPAGVTLAGPGTIRGDGATAITLETRDGLTTSARELSVASATMGTGVVTGIATRGDGIARVSAVDVQSTLGVGMALGALRSEVDGSHVHGAVTEANRSDVRWLAPRASVEATHGVIVSRGTLIVTDTTIDGFAEVALGLGSAQGDMVVGPIDASLTDVTLRRGLGIGIASSAGTLGMERVTIDQIWTGVRGWPSYAALLIDGSVTTHALTVTNADGFGIVEVAGDARHDALTLAHTGDAGLWAGTGVTLSLVNGSSLTDTAFAALTAVDASSVALTDTTIADVRVVRRTVGVRGAIDVGDGLDLVGTPLTLARVAIRGAGRVGLALDHGALAASHLADVTVTAEGVQLGAILGDVDRTGETLMPVSSAGWDSGITRLGVAAANDAALTTPLAISVAAMPPSAGAALGVIAPMY